MGFRLLPLGMVAAVALAAPAADALAFTTSKPDPEAPGTRAAGRLIFTAASGLSARCSAAVVDAPNQSTIVTAGHCLSTAADGPAVSATFMPAYHDGVAPFGQWKLSQVLLAPPWAAGYNKRYDYAFAVVGRNSGRAIEDVVGGFPIAFNQPRAQAYRILGLPGEPTPPYDGTDLWACDTTYDADSTSDGSAGPPRMRAECDFGIGASGGPWLTASGVVASVSSTRFTTPADRLSAPYFDSDAAALFAQAGSISTAPKKAKKCKRKKAKRSATAAKKKRCKKRKGRR